jgi:hypothetical protein
MLSFGFVGDRHYSSNGSLVVRRPTGGVDQEINAPLRRIGIRLLAAYYFPCHLSSEGTLKIGAHVRMSVSIRNGPKQNKMRSTMPVRTLVLGVMCPAGGFFEARGL